MIIITKKDIGSSILNCRPVQRTNKTTADVIDRYKDIYLIYFRSDMTGRVAYALTSDITDYGTKRSNYQYTDIGINQVHKETAQDIYNSEVYFNPAGSWYYIIYEVNYREGIEVTYDKTQWDMLAAGYSPINTLGEYEEWGGEGPPPEDCRGILGLAVEEGKLLVEQVPEAVTYNQHTQTNDNYIYTK